MGTAFIELLVSRIVFCGSNWRHARMNSQSCFQRKQEQFSCPSIPRQSSVCALQTLETLQIHPSLS